MADRLGQFSEPVARQIYAVVKQLIASGYALPGSSQQSRAQFTQRPTLFVNDSGEEIPPFACMQITEMEDFGKNYAKVDKYDEDVFGGFLFNGPRSVADDKVGMAQATPRFRATREDNTDAVTAGHLWGPDPGEWFLKPNGGPWAALALQTESSTETVMWLHPDIATTYRATVTTEVTARSGSTDGAGVVTIKTVGASNATATLQTGVAVTSLLSSTVAVSAETVVSRTTNGRLQIISEDCG